MSGSDDLCRDCGGRRRLEDQTSMSGRKIRDYSCEKCGKSVLEDAGVALWQLLHDANEAKKTDIS